MFNQQPMTPSDHLRSTLNWWLFLARVGAVSVEVFLHKRFGQRYCRLQALMVVPLGMIYGWLWNFQGYDIKPLIQFFLAFFVALIISQIGVVLRLRRGDQEHSQYSGWPLLLRESNAAREKLVKQWLEPLLVLVIGMLVNQHNRPLGVYLIFTACSLFICNGIALVGQRRQVLDLQDAVFEQQQTAGSFRSMQDG